MSDTSEICPIIDLAMIGGGIVKEWYDNLDDKRKARVDKLLDELRAAEKGKVKEKDMLNRAVNAHKERGEK